MWKYARYVLTGYTICAIVCALYSMLGLIIPEMFFGLTEEQGIELLIYFIITGLFSMFASIIIWFNGS